MDGIVRIQTLSSEIKDKALLKIIEYLLSRTDMNEKYLNEEKSLKQMVEFIKSLAKKEAENGIAMIEDEAVYGWAIHYWDESNSALKIENKKIEETKEEKVHEDKIPQPLNVKTKNSKEWIAEGQLTLF